MSKIPFKTADILLPENADMTKWSVVACDQYTSEPKYWEDVKNVVDSSPSTFNMIFPEIYLEDGDAEERIESINTTMEKYINDGVFKTLKDSLVYVERTVLNGKIRRGIVGSVDLEHYDYNKGSTSLIRATEGTVIERIPPRVKVRINASVELPHIMLLIDDEKDIVFKSINKETATPVYDFDLMCQSGHIKGYQIDGTPVINALSQLYEQMEGDNKLLFAVGDGNHSLATAKECWEQIKKCLTEEQKETHPARFPLVEIVNIHDSSLEFEPIHRIVFNCNSEHLLGSLKQYYKCNNDGVGQKITYVINGEKEDIYVSNPSSQLTVGTLQNFLDYYLKNNNCKIDYIHGEDVVLELTKQSNTIGFLLPPMEKSELFPTVIKDGSLPRKTFSMGEAWEKRFYLECKLIK